MDPQTQQPLDTPTANRLATGAPGTLALGGKTYLVMPATKADFVTLRKYLISLWERPTDDTLAAIVGGLKALPPELAKHAVEIAVKDTRRKATAEELEELLLAPAGVAFWTWLQIRKQHPEFTLEAAQAAITDANVDDVIGQLLDAGGLKESDPN